MKKLVLFFLICFVSPCFGDNLNKANALYEVGMKEVNAGNPFGAIKYFVKACHLAPFNDKYTNQLALARYMAGKALVEQGEVEDAKIYFDLAIKQQPNNPEFHLGLFELYFKIKNRDLALVQGNKVLTLVPWDSDLVRYLAICMCKLQDTQTAIGFLKNYVKDYGSSLVVNKLLGGLLYERGFLEEALFYLDKVQGTSIKNTEIAQLLDKIKEEFALKTELRQSLSEHFILWVPSFVLAPEDTELLDELENIYNELGALFDFHPYEHVEVLFLTEKNYQKLQNHKENTLGQYDGKIIVAIENDEEVDVDKLLPSLRHEYVHHLVFLLSEGTAPLWLNEGMAQLLEEMDMEAVLEKHSKDVHLSFENIEDLYARAVRSNNLDQIYRWALVKTLKIASESGLDSLLLMLRPAH